MKDDLRMKIGCWGVLLIAAWSTLAARAGDWPDLVLHYEKPAAECTSEALPLGNGRLGCLVFGNVEQDRISFDENSLWSGDAGTPATCERFGELVFETAPASATNGVTGYRRELSLDDAEARVTFTRGGVTYSRSVFVSQPDQVLVVRWTADRSGHVNGFIRLRAAHGEGSQADGDTIGFSGRLANGLEYAARARVYAKGGKLEASDEGIRLSGCDEAWVALAAETSYVMDPAKDYRGDPPAARIDEVLSEVSRFGFDLVRMRHLAHHQCFFRQLRLDLGPSPPERRAMTTERRLAAYAADGIDPELEALLFQFGRYLLLSSSHRTGLPEKYLPKQTFGWYPGAAQRPCLPVHAQGLWCVGPPTAYAVDGSLQMSYWAAEPANVDKCHLPLFDLMRCQREPWSRSTQASAEFGRRAEPTRGWAVRSSVTPLGTMAGEWESTANAWLCLHLWQHYEFIGSQRGRQVYVERMAYPLMKAACEFWEDQLEVLPDGRLAVEGGSPGDQELVWDLFNNYAAVCHVLKVDPEYGKTIAGMRDRLALAPIREAEHERDLFGVYPGRRVARTDTPEAAKEAAAALAAMETKDSDPGASSLPWRCGLWARLGQGNGAHRQVRRLMTEAINPNLCCGKPAFRVDANLGLTGAMCEMLLQSHDGVLKLLPALPAAWPTGTVQGLKAAGGVRVDIAWSEGKVTSYKIATEAPQPVQVALLVNGETLKVTADKGDTLLEFQGW